MNALPAETPWGIDDLAAEIEELQRERGRLNRCLDNSDAMVRRLDAESSFGVILNMRRITRRITKVNAELARARRELRALSPAHPLVAEAANLH